MLCSGPNLIVLEKMGTTLLKIEYLKILIFLRKESIAFSIYKIKSKQKKCLPVNNLECSDCLIVQD